MKEVYLAGPITGLTYDGCTEWRDIAAASLKDSGIKGLSPMRAKAYLKSLADVISSTGEEYAHMGVMSQARSVTTRDRNDATKCDLLLVNLLGATRVSIGTMIELGWADSNRIPIVCIMEKTGNPHEHMMVAEMIGFRVETLEDALHIVKVVLS